MAAILIVPDEVLAVIFEELCIPDLQECQKVCRSWYFTAHVRLLIGINLRNSTTIERFIASVDYNSDPAYTSAVKRIYISTQDDPSYRLTTENIEKLFFRFPNLKDVEFDSSLTLLEHFNDKVCQSFLKKCAKLDTFQVYVNDKQEGYYDSLYNKLRLLLTTIDTEDIDYVSNTGLSFLQFVSSFPRLQNVHGFSDNLDSFQKWLFVLERVPNLKSIDLWKGQDEQNFAMQYFASKSKERLDLLVERLVKITHLVLAYDQDFCPDTVIFAHKYLNGLDTFRFLCNNSFNWTALQETIFCSDILDSACSAKEEGAIYIPNVKLDTMTSYFSIIMRKLFHQASATRILQLTIEDIPLGLTGLEIELGRYQRKIVISLTNRINVLEITKELFKTVSSIKYVDEFILTINKRADYTPATDIYTYDYIFSVMPALKKLVLDVPATLGDLYGAYHCETTFPQVEDVTLRATKNANCQILLDRFIIAFPNLRHLALYYYSGKWKEDTGEFSINLQRYSLQALTIDVTPIKKEYLKQRNSIENGFFVVHIQLASSSVAYLYRVPIQNISSASTISDIDLKSLKCGEDYLGVCISVADLKQLELVIGHAMMDDETYLHNSGTVDTSRVVLFNKDQKLKVIFDIPA